MTQSPSATPVSPDPAASDPTPQGAPPAPSHASPMADNAAVTAHLERAKACIRANDREGAKAACQAALGCDDVPLKDATSVCLMLRALNHDPEADMVRARIIDGIEAHRDSGTVSQGDQVTMGEIADALDAPDLAEDLLRKAYRLDASDAQTALSLAIFLVRKDRKAEAVEVIEPAITASEQPAKLLMYYSNGFAHFGATDESAAMLDRARPLCKTSNERAKLDVLLAGVRGERRTLNQHGMAVELFDDFAAVYDTQLAKLGNNGPDVIHHVLSDLDLPVKRTRRILDAGCGTGLCAQFLKPFAKELHGVDLSVGMLEKCREKGQYDLLARTDLSVSATYPEGPFDMVVCGDVLVYFADLGAVFANFINIMTPGGWLIVSLEQEMDEDTPAGYRLYGSGRHKHTEPYVRATLASAGFAKPKITVKDRLRNEMAEPVMGLALAVQKPALLGF